MKKIWVIFFGCCTALVLFQDYFQLPLLGYRRMGLMGVVVAAASAGAYLINLRVLQPRFNRMTPGEKATLIGLALAIPSLFLLMQGFLAKNFFIYALAPQHTLTITLPQQSTNDQAELIWFKTSFREINLRTLNANGNWSFPGKSHAIGKPGEAVSLSWQGKVGTEAQLVLKPTAESFIVQINWDGNLENINLQRPDLNAEVNYTVSFPEDALPSRILLLGAVWLFGVFLFFALGVFLATQSYRPPQNAPKRAEWLLYMLPMILVWGIFLLTYWPGMISADSINQWQQVQDRSFNDWHPAIHTMLIWLLTRFWNHPAVEGIFQILALSLTAAWGLKTLGDFGVRRGFLWVGAALFALLPVNGFMVITYWKDILYSTALLAFFIVYLQLILTRGDWLNHRGRLAGMTAIMLIVSLFRHNGFLTVMIAVIPLFILFRRQWKPLLIAVILLVGLRSLIRGPIYDALKVTRHPGQSSLVLVHHVAAHIHAGTPLNAQEQAYLNTIHPLPNWPYDCTYAGKTTYSPNFSRSVFEQSPWPLRKLSLDLFLRDPWVDIEHMICNGQLVWALPLEIRIRQVPLYYNSEGASTWVQENSFGLTEASLLPKQVAPLHEFYRWTFLNAPLWRPAFYLLFLLFCIPLVVLRRKCSPLLLLPPISQALLIFVFNVAPSFRFMYPATLIALFCIVCLFLPLAEDNKEKTSHPA